MFYIFVLVIIHMLNHSMLRTFLNILEMVEKFSNSVYYCYGTFSVNGCPGTSDLVENSRLCERRTAAHMRGFRKSQI